MSGKKKTSAVWNHFNEIEHLKAQCNICSRTISFSAGNVSNLNRHLVTRHPTMALTITPKKPKIELDTSTITQDGSSFEMPLIEISDNNEKKTTFSQFAMKNKEDVYDKFGKYVAAQLRSLTSREAAVTQLDIQNVLTAAIIKNLTTNTDTYDD